MKLTNEQVILLSVATAAVDLGFELNELNTENARMLRMSIEHSPIYYELYNIENTCPIDAESSYWMDHFMDKNVEDLNDFEKSILNV